MISIFIGGKVYPKRRHIFPMLKPFEKGDGYSDHSREALYNISEKDVTFVDSIADAMYVVLPMSWNFYLNNGALNDAKRIVKEANAHDKTVISFMIGDFGIKIPFFDNVKVFRHSGNRSSLHETHLGLPAFIEDPLEKIFQKKLISFRTYNETPTVGFCGQTNGTAINAVKEILATLARNIRTRLGLSDAQPQQLLSTSFLRASVLKWLEKSDKVDSNFIYRKKYRAGANTVELRKKTTLEFYENLSTSDYVVCVRGAGNFSVRFYETLAMGRIPVFVNTDCLLPLDGKIPWKNHVVWVEYKDRKNIVKRVAEFHGSLTAKQFEDLQQQNRTLWKEKLTLGGFFKTILSE